MSRTSVSNFLVNVEYLRNWFEEHGVILADASASIGRSKSYLSHKLMDGVFNESDALLLEAKFGLKKSDYELKASDVFKDKVQFVEGMEYEEAPKPVVLDYDKLYQTIYSAVVEGMKQALEG